MAWELAYPIGAVLLAGALLFGVLRLRKRTPRERAASEAAARQVYEEPAPDEKTRLEAGPPKA